MTLTLPGEPNTDYDFGQDFDYSLWTPGTRIDLVNVPWVNDYRDVVRFANAAALDTYINGLAPAMITISQMSYVKPNEPVRINVPHNRVNNYNYLRATNPLQPIPGDETQNYYYFILDTKYVAPNTTEIVIQLDVWQTYIYNVTLGTCYVERGHVGIANEHAFDNYGRDYLTIPEGIDTGSDLRIIHSAKDVIMTSRDKTGPVYEVGTYNIIVVSTIQLESDPGTVAAPKMTTAWGSEGLGMPGGASVYGWQNQTAFSSWLFRMSGKPWVTQGIIAAVIVPPIQQYYPDHPIDWEGDIVDPTPLEYHPPSPITHTLVKNWRDVIMAAIPPKYKYLKKFLTSPYSMLELTTLAGNPITIKPELWPRNDAVIRQFANLLPPGAKFIFFPDGYNGTGSDNVNAEGFDHSTGIVNPPTMSIVNNMGIAYLASHASSLGWAKDSAGWAQQRALQGAQTDYGNSTFQQNVLAEQAAAYAKQQFGSAANQNLNLANQAVTGTLGGMVSGAIGGGAFGNGPAGAVAGALQSGIEGLTNQANALHQTGYNNQNALLNVQGNIGNTSAQQRGMAGIQDSNKKLADWAAKGDYANAIAGINAQIHDTNLIQPSVSGQQGGDVLNFLSQEYGIHIRIKLIDQAAIHRIGDYWLRYGYTVQAFMRPPPDFKVMSKYSYWKMQETYITAAPMPESFKQSIRGIFEKGVTVWVNPSEIGNVYMESNTPLPGFAY